ncbi:MAG: AEC family transporter [Halarchaeum sp.]
MSNVAEVIVTAILPTFLIIGVGVALEWAEGVDAGPLNTLTMFVLTPALTVHSIALTELDASALLKISGGVVAFLAAALAASWVVGRALGMKGAFFRAFELVAAFGNAGSLGIPLSAFAFGAVGRQTAVLFAAVHGAFVFTVGMGIAASSGGESRLASLREVLRYPIVYAVVVAAAARVAGVVPAADSAAMQTLGMVGDASIPVMLVILGVQLAGTKYRHALAGVVAPTAFRFVVSPAIGLAVALLLGFANSTVARVFVLLTAMPVAIAPVIFVVEFASDTTVRGVTLPEYVSVNVLVTTLVSIPVLTVVVYALQSGAII